MTIDRRLDDALPGAGGRPQLREISDNRSHVAENESAILFIFRMMERRKWTILLALVLIPLLTALAVSRMTPLYTATITLITEPRQVSLADIQGLEVALPDTSIESQIEVIKSRNLAERTVDELGLVFREEFNPALKDESGGLASTLGSALGGINLAINRTTGVWVFPPQTTPGQSVDSAQNKEIVVRTFQKRLDVRGRGRSRVIEVGFASEDPTLAKDAVTALANHYIESQLEVKFESMQRVQSYLNEQLDTLRLQVEVSEKAIEEFREREGLVEGVQSTIVTEQVSDLSNQLILARTDLAAAEARLAQIRSLGRGVIPNEQEYAGLRTLREAEATARAQLANTRSNFGPRHPDVVRQQNELGQLQGSIFQEIARISQSVEAEVQANRARVSTLEQQLASDQSRASKADAAKISLRSLERQAQSDQDLLQSSLELYRAATTNFDIEEPDARVLSQAFAPTTPSFPNNKLFIAVAIVIGAMVGLLLAYIEELLDQTFRSGEEVEGAFGIPSVAIPKIGRPGWRVPFLDYVLARPASVFAENIRSLRTLLWLTDAHTRARCVVVTSSRSGEGKTTTAVALARASALGGEKVMLVDCDLSRPSVHTTFKMADPDIGLTDLLSGRAARSEVTRTDPNLTNLQYITAGRDPKNGGELLRSDNMISLIRELRKEYDLVIVDTPPTLTVSDTKVLSTMADAVLFCVRGRATTFSTASAGIKALSDVGANVLCVALTQVKFRSMKKSERQDMEVYARARQNRVA